MHCVAAVIKAATPPPVQARGQRQHRPLPAAAMPTPRVPATARPAAAITSPQVPARRRVADIRRRPRAREATARPTMASSNRPISNNRWGITRELVRRLRGMDRRVTPSPVLAIHNSSSNNNNNRVKPILDMHSRTLLTCR